MLCKAKRSVDGARTRTRRTGLMTIAHMARCDGNGAAAEVSEGVGWNDRGVADMTCTRRDGEGANGGLGQSLVPGRSVCTGPKGHKGCEWLESMEGT